MAGLSGFGLSVMPWEYMEPLPALMGIDEMLVFGVWPLPVLLGMLGEVVALELLGGKRPPVVAARCGPPAGGYVREWLLCPATCCALIAGRVRLRSSSVMFESLE